MNGGSGRERVGKGSRGGRMPHSCCTGGQMAVWQASEQPPYCIVRGEGVRLIARRTTTRDFSPGNNCTSHPVILISNPCVGSYSNELLKKKVCVYNRKTPTETPQSKRRQVKRHLRFRRNPVPALLVSAALVPGTVTTRSPAIADAVDNPILNWFEAQADYALAGTPSNTLVCHSTKDRARGNERPRGGVAAGDAAPPGAVPGGGEGGASCARDGGAWERHGGAPPAGRVHGDERYARVPPRGCLRRPPREQRCQPALRPVPRAGVPPGVVPVHRGE